jgi:hypothetical protein
MLSDRSAPMGGRYYHPAEYGCLYAHFIMKQINDLIIFAICLDQSLVSSSEWLARSIGNPS